MDSFRRSFTVAISFVLCQLSVVSCSRGRESSQRTTDHGQRTSKRNVIFLKLLAVVEWGLGSGAAFGARSRLATGRGAFRTLIVSSGWSAAATTAVAASDELEILHR